MSIRQLNPYLNFDGTAEKAIRFYEDALGAKTETLSRFGDVQGIPVAPEHKTRVMHALLRIGGGVVMVSDGMPGQPVPPAGNVHVILDFDDSKDMARRFDALSAGGKITMPMQDTFWGATFGMCTDRYGISWMLNCSKEQRPAS
jgi:PhnB protein